MNWSARRQKGNPVSSLQRMSKCGVEAGRCSVNQVVLGKTLPIVLWTFTGRNGRSVLVG